MSIQENVFGTMADGTPVNIYTLQNTAGMKAEIIPYGCRIVRLWAPDRNGNFGDMLMGHDDLAGYCAVGDCHGAAIGRFANRIAGAKMEINGATYILNANEGKNTLHGGKVGFHHKLWEVTHMTDSETPSITFQYVSKDGEEGFPGTLTTNVTYTVTADNALQIEYSAVTDKETAINLTNHSYFNISGDSSKDVLSQTLQINADYYTAANDELIPTGELISVTGTPLDFSAPKTIGRDIGSDDKLMHICGGYDHNFVLNGNGIKKSAVLFDSPSGRVMEVFTDLPGMQLYTANGFGDDAKSKGGVKMQAHHAVCLETQFYPDSVHQPKFPYSFLKPGEKFNSTTIYKFSVK